MGKSKGSAPAAPDPYKTASAESQFNRIDTFSPSGGGVRHGYTGPDGTFQPGVAPQGFQSAQTYVESDAEKAIRERVEPASVSLVDRIVSDNIEGMPGAPRVQDRGTVGDSIFRRAMSMLSPQIEQSNRRLMSNLQNRGIPIGSEAFNDAYGEQQRQTQDTIARLAMDADVASGQEQSRLFGLDQAQRSSAISELVAAFGGGYNPMTSVPSGQAANVNYGALVGDKYRADLAAYEQQQQSRMQSASAIGSLGAALIKSSQGFKEVFGQVDHTKAVVAVKAMPVQAWRYLPEHAPDGDAAQHIGPMAEHFQAATGLGDGKSISMIDYLGLLHSALQAALWRIDVLEYELRGGRVN